MLRDMGNCQRTSLPILTSAKLTPPRCWQLPDDVSTRKGHLQASANTLADLQREWGNSASEKADTSAAYPYRAMYFIPVLATGNSFPNCQQLYKVAWNL
jgi:hypothetical protein